MPVIMPVAMTTHPAPESAYETLANSRSASLGGISKPPSSFGTQKRRMPASVSASTTS